jgi:hypothetical protein
VSTCAESRWQQQADAVEAPGMLRAAPPLVVFGSAGEERAAALYLLYPLVCELHDRYAALQGRIRAAWWERDGEIELLAALCARRALLDARAQHPESAAEQISFLLDLPLLADHLTQSHGSGSFDPARDQPAFLAALRRLAAHDGDTNGGHEPC